MVSIGTWSFHDRGFSKMLAGQTALLWSSSHEQRLTIRLAPNVGSPELSPFITGNDWGCVALVEVAQMMRVGFTVRCMSRRCAVRNCGCDHRKLLQSKGIAIENDLRGTLRNFGLKVGTVGTVKFEARIKELVENLPDLADWSNRCSLSGGR